ncbi:RTA1 like protein-domain-containing protein [Aspergillus karnatakaensis]|uniref:RTA1 domain-containing protein n=1 Tax=Aspergillus karnatakaensis TaxID=1810916 RepID=UPI003CCD1742
MSDQLPDTPACEAYNATLNPGSYGYQPSLSWGIVFTLLFTIIATGHLYHMLRTRAFWTFVFIVGAILEIIGWVGRTISWRCPYSRTTFLMQTATLIMGPSWTQAGIYVTLWVLIRSLGRHTSPFPPKTYLLVCFIIDVVCLTTQAIGGGLAGGAYSSGNSTQPGTTTMIVGVIAQLAAAVIFSFLLSFVLWRGRDGLARNRPLTLMASATVFATLMMIMRNVYRSIELSEGWRGYLITHERYVLALDALPMVLSMGVYVVFHPGREFGRDGQRDSEVELREDGFGEGEGAGGNSKLEAVQRFMKLQ